jgi:hypothetical protein
MQPASPTRAEPPAKVMRKMRAVLHRRADGLAEVGCLQQALQSERYGKRDGKADQQLGTGVERTKGKGSAAQQGRDVEQICRKQHEREILHQD